MRLPENHFYPLNPHKKIMDVLHYSDFCADEAEVNACLEANFAPNQIVSKIHKLCDNTIPEIHKALIKINPQVHEKDNAHYLIAEDVRRVFELL